MKTGLFAQILTISFLGFYTPLSEASEEEWLLVDIPNGWRETAKKDTPYPIQQFSPADESFDDPNYRIIRHRFGNVEKTRVEDYQRHLKSSSEKNCKSPKISYQPLEDSFIAEVLCPKDKSDENGYASLQKITQGEKYLWVAEYSWRTAPFRSKPEAYAQSKDAVYNYLSWSKTCWGDAACQALRNEYNDYLIQTGRRAEIGVIRKSPKIEKW